VVKEKNGKLIFLIVIAVACGMLAVACLVSSAVFANRATRQWYDRDYRYQMAYGDALTNFKKNNPRADLAAGSTRRFIEKNTKVRMWKRKYDPPEGRRNQGIANVCGVLGIIGLAALVASLFVIWEAKKKGDVKDAGEEDHSSGPEDLLDEAGVSGEKGDEGRPTFIKRAWHACTRALVVPQVAFTVVGLLFGLTMLVVNPPFQVMDEHAHFAKAYSIAEGHLKPALKRDSSDNSVEKVGVDLPASIKYTYQRSKFWPPKQKRTLGDIASAMNIPLGSKYSSFNDFSAFGSTIAPPVSYLPQSLGVALGRLFHLSPLLLMYLGRIFNLLFFIAIVSLAIAITPIIKWAFFLIGLMPLTINLSASLSYDAPMIAICFLVVAYILYLALDPAKESINRKDIYILLILAVLIALVKQPYSLILLLFFIIPSSKFQSRKQYLLVFAATMGTVILVGGAWSLWLRDTNQLQVIRGGAKPQLRDILSNPSHAVRVLATTINVRKEEWLVQVVGGLGWFQVTLPAWFSFTYLFSIASVAALDKEDIAFRVKQKAIAIGVALLIMFAVLMILYVGATPVGQTVIEGFNPRYFIPVLPLVFLLFYNTSIRYEKGKYFYLFLLLITILTVFITMTEIVRYYY
jgi:uncharacterized membrane protein